MRTPRCETYLRYHKYARNAPAKCETARSPARAARARLAPLPPLPPLLPSSAPLPRPDPSSYVRARVQAVHKCVLTRQSGRV